MVFLEVFRVPGGPGVGALHFLCGSLQHLPALHVLSPEPREIPGSIVKRLSGWWFGNVWNMFYFSIYWEQSSQLTNIFQRG